MVVGFGSEYMYEPRLMFVSFLNNWRGRTSGVLQGMMDVLALVVARPTEKVVQRIAKTRRANHHQGYYYKF